MSAGLGTASATVSEGTAGNPTTHTFSGQFQTRGPLVPLTSATVAFTEAGGGISDILTYSYTGGGGGDGSPLGVATLTGTFVSDTDPGGSLAAPIGATLVPEGTPFTFNNTNITASAVSDRKRCQNPRRLRSLGRGFWGSASCGIAARRIDVCLTDFLS